MSIRGIDARSPPLVFLLCLLLLRNNTEKLLYKKYCYKIKTFKRVLEKCRYQSMCFLLGEPSLKPSKERGM